MKPSDFPKTKWVPIGSIRPSTYNPRQADPARLDLVELSLRKLGFLLPLCADADGEILSGHQRHHVATRMGAKRVPVTFTKPMELNKRKAVNIACNRATNDFVTSDSSQSITGKILALDMPTLAQQIPDKDLASDAFARCVQPEWVAIDPMLKANAGRWIDYAQSVTRTLAHSGVILPIVATRDGKVMNGLGRLQYFAAMKYEKVPVVYVTDEEAQFSQSVLNLLSMDFDIKGRYGDLLRHNSFRRTMATRNRFGHAFIDYVWHGKLESKNINLAQNPAQKKAWVKEHGTSVVEFGGGHCTDGDFLRAAGIHCASFEPYRLTGNDHIDIEASRTHARAFLADVASGRRYSSVFCPVVLNSVPFKEDRLHVLNICAALCDDTSKLYCTANGTRGPVVRYLATNGILSDRGVNSPGFKLDYEENTVLGDLTSLPKMQHYFTPPEMAELVLTFWASVKTYELLANTMCRAWHRRTLDLPRLRSAIEFEFNLPYPDGQRMNLVEVALSAFSQRLKVVL